MTRLPLFAAALTFALLSASWSDAGEVDQLPLHVRLPKQRVLLVFPYADEAKLAQDTLSKLGVPFEYAKNFDESREDYSGIFAIISGSNAFDYFGYGGEKLNAPEAFNHVEDFIRNGGHLFAFGSFNGRNLKHLNRFDHWTYTQHGTLFEEVEGHSEVFFHGMEENVPPGKLLYSTGNFGFNRDFVCMLRRGKGRASMQPALATASVEMGRLSYTGVQPSNANSMWLLPVAVTWVARGAPTTTEQLDENPVVDPLTFGQLQHGMGLKFSAEQMQKLQSEVCHELMLDQLNEADRPSALLQAAEKSEDNEQKSALLTLAAELYSQQGNADAAMAALRSAASLLQMNVATEQVRLLKQSAMSTSHKEELEEIARLALDFQEDALEDYRFTESWELAVLAQQVSDQCGHERYRSLAGRALIRTEPLNRAWLNVASSFDRWPNNPEDPEANLAVGRFLSFVANEWEIGLGCLAEGNDDDLRDLATLSLKHEAEPLDRVRLADRWMRFSEKLDEQEQLVIQKQCRIWYQQAYAELSGGSEAARVKRILDSAPQAGGELKIKLELDGYGELTITPEKISWTTQSGEEPARIYANGLEWDPRQNVELRNRGSTRFLEDDVSLKSPRAKTTSGRAFTRVVETSPDKLVIRLSDVPIGSATSEILIEFGK